MTNKIYIVQSYCTTEDGLYCPEPCYIENLICNSREEAEKVSDFIDNYNEEMTGKFSQINSYSRIVEIDLESVKFDTLESVMKTHLARGEEC